MRGPRGYTCPRIMRRLATILLLTSPLLLAERCPSDKPAFFDLPDAGTRDATEGCGGEGAAGGYTKAGGTWDGSAGNPYGAPSDVSVDCAGFGLFSTALCGFFESCSLSCEGDTDCPVVDGGPAPVCDQDANLPPTCILPCSDEAPCPPGMQCVYDRYHYGNLCLWPKAYGQ